MQFLGAFERQFYRQRADEGAGSKGQHASHRALGDWDIQTQRSAQD
jgi:hypothetical protein